MEASFVVHGGRGRLNLAVPWAVGNGKPGGDPVVDLVDHGLTAWGSDVDRPIRGPDELNAVLLDFFSTYA